jgi:hypothetical protein
MKATGREALHVVKSVSLGSWKNVGLKRCKNIEVDQTDTEPLDQPIALNRLQELVEPTSKPNEIWCADITYTLL